MSSHNDPSQQRKLNKSKKIDLANETMPETRKDRCMSDTENNAGGHEALSGEVVRDITEYSGDAKSLMITYRQILHDIQQAPSQPLTVTLSATHPLAHCVHQLQETYPSLNVHVKYPNQDYYKQAIGRDALIPVTVHSETGVRVLRSDEAQLLNSEILTITSENKVVCGKHNHEIGQSVGGVIFVHPIQSNIQASGETNLVISNIGTPKLQRSRYPQLLKLNKTTGEYTRLLNTSPDGSWRYELEGRYLDALPTHDLIWRESPARGYHHTKKLPFQLDSHELVLIPKSGAHVVAMTFSNQGVPQEGYININLQPERSQTGFNWKDLELDIKLVRGNSNRWESMLLDLKEYEVSNLSSQHRQVCEDEIGRIYDQMERGIFPFCHDSELFLAIWEKAQSIMEK
jgi:predicted RNA-binding protein associated with RNAse of E/G family